MPEWVGVTALTWLQSTGVDILRYAVFAIGIWLVLWVLLRRVMRPRKIREATPPARQLIVEFLVSLRSIAVFSTVGLIMFGLESVGLLPGPAIAAGWGAWWFAASLILMIVATTLISTGPTGLSTTGVFFGGFTAVITAATTPRRLPPTAST